jgi:glutamate synthase domain-containing protein 3
MKNINIEVGLRTAYDINKEMKKAAESNDTITLKNVLGQRFIGSGISKEKKIKIYGVPGNDLGAYMDGPEIEVFSNVQDAIGNTMNKGSIIVHGSCGDTAGYAMRGGEIFIKENVGYRVGIHMKEYLDMKPAIVIGGTAGDFLGEYMAGGVIILLGLNASKKQPLTGKFCGTGIHGGAIYVNGTIESHKLGKELKPVKMEQKDISLIENYIKQYRKYFKYEDEIKTDKFSKYMAVDTNPYKKMYIKY